MTPQHLNRIKLLPDKYLFAEKLPKFSEPFENMVHSHKGNSEFMKYSQDENQHKDILSQIKIFGKTYPAISDRNAKARKFQNFTSRFDGSMNSFDLSLL